MKTKLTKIVVVNLGETMDRLGRHRFNEQRHFAEQPGIVQAIKDFHFEGDEKMGEGEAFAKHMKKRGFNALKIRSLRIP